MSAEAIVWFSMPVLLLAAGWFAHATWEQPHRNELEQALEQARLELKALTAHTMARHKARSDAAVRGHATRRGKTWNANHDGAQTVAVQEAQP